jgi:hypothetical protein
LWLTLRFVIPMTEAYIFSQKVDHDWVTNISMVFHYLFVDSNDEERISGSIYYVQVPLSQGRERVQRLNRIEARFKE